MALLGTRDINSLFKDEVDPFNVHWKIENVTAITKQIEDDMSCHLSELLLTCQWKQFRE